MHRRKCHEFEKVGNETDFFFCSFCFTIANISEYQIDSEYRALHQNNARSHAMALSIDFFFSLHKMLVVSFILISTICNISDVLA